MSLIFVYGTLKRGCRNHHYLAGQQFLGEALTGPGYILYSLGDYPGMIISPDPNQQVVGEIWSVAEPCLTQLDELEGVGEQLYARVPIRLAPPHDQLAIETYLYLPSIIGRPALGSVWRE
ncbi:MAG: gamma-glutamylcyclotransferase [Opitutae bacterium]